MVDDIVEQLGHLALGTRLKRLGERMQAETSRYLDARGLPVPASQFPLLAALDRPGGLTVGELAEAVGVSQPGITRSVARLADQGLITVTHGSADRRRRSVRLTAAGRPSWRGRGPTCGRPSRPRWSRRATGSRVTLLAQLAELEARLDRVPLDRRAATPMPRGRCDRAGAAPRRTSRREAAR